MLDFAVVGSGIGGSLFALTNKEKNIALFEQDSNLGGCASTFTRYGYKFNTGATTFVGYENNHLIHNLFTKNNIIPNIKKSSNSMRVIQNGKVLDRVQDFEEFLGQVETLYPNKNNRVFWTRIKEIDEKFWEIKNLYFAKHSMKNYLKTLLCGTRLLVHFKGDIFKSSDRFIFETLGNISKEYRAFIDAGLQITVQQNSNNLPLIFFALGLAYPFHNVYYVNGGMGRLFDTILDGINLYKNTQIHKIEKYKSNYILHTQDSHYETKNVILNTTLFDSKKLFDDKNIVNYYDSFDFYDQSAFTIYMKLDSKKEFEHHYQIILDEIIPNTTSNSFFISFSDRDDDSMNKDGYSITISTHSKASFWFGLEKEEYEIKKQQSIDFIVGIMIDILGIQKDEIKKVFGGTSKTFKSFIVRANCGGIPNNFNTILNMAGVNTPFDGLYQVGDTLLGAQGWPGVALGVDMLNRVIDE